MNADDGGGAANEREWGSLFVIRSDGERIFNSRRGNTKRAMFAISQAERKRLVCREIVAKDGRK